MLNLNNNKRMLKKTSTMLLAVLIVLGSLTLTGCHTDMWVQPKAKPQAESDFFPDDQSSRPLVPHTVDRDHLRTDQPYYTGWVGGTLNSQGELAGADLVDKIPARALKQFENSPEKLLARGQQRFDIFCSPCHSRIGDGQGMIAIRGFSQARPPGNYHTKRLREMPIGHFYDVITNGYGNMYSYASRIEPQDRWAIAAYVRVLQESQNGRAENLTPEETEQATKTERLSPPEPATDNGKPPK